MLDNRLPNWITSIVQFTKRKNNNQNSHIDVHKVRHVEFIEMDGSSISTMLINFLNQNVYACTSV